MRLVATCPEETKPALIGELQALGVRDPQPGFRAVEFEAEPRLAYELHLRLRTASRLFRVLKEVPAHSPEMLYSQVRRIRWPELFDARHSFMVESVGAETGPGSMAARQVITQVREAIRAAFASAGRAHSPDRYRRAQGRGRRAPRARALHAELRHGRQGIAQARVPRIRSSRAAQGNAGRGDPPVCGLRRHAGLPRPDVRQRHARDRGGDDRRPQGTADPSQERRLLPRVAGGLRPATLARSTGRRPRRKARLAACAGRCLRHRGQVRRDGAQERTQGAGREIHFLRRRAFPGPAAACGTWPAGDEPAVRRPHRRQRRRRATAVRGGRRHAQAEVQRLAGRHSRGSGVALPGDRPAAAPDDRTDQRQHPVQAAAVRVVCWQPADGPT